MKISTEVMTALSLVACERNLARMPDMPRPLYLKVDPILQALGGKWNRSAKAHVWPVGVQAAERIDMAILAGEVTTAKDLGFFATPAPLAVELCELAEVEAGHCVLEPEAGEGAIMSALLDLGAYVHGVELDRGRFDHLCTRFHALTVGDCAGERVSVSDGVRIQLADFMTVNLEKVPSTPFFDRVVMNPMFMRSGVGDHLDHVKHAYTGLRPGGILVAVLPVSIGFRKDKRHTDFRHWYQNRADFQVRDLPEGSFKSSGTSVHTVTLKIVR